MRFYSFLLFSIFLVLCAKSQILKVDRSHFESDSSGYMTGAVGGSFNLNNRGSTPEEQNVYVGVTGNSDFVYVAKSSATILIGNISYFKIGDGPVVYNGSLHLREVLNRQGILSPEFFAQTQFDESRNMEVRELLGAGLRCNILRGDNSLHTGVGIINEHENWQLDSLTIMKDLWKMSSYIGGDVSLSDAVSLNTVCYFQSGYDSEIDRFRNRVSAFVQIESSISEHVSITSTVNFLMDDRPIIPTPRFIYETFFGLKYKFN